MRQREKVILFGRGMVYERKKEILHREYEIEVFLDNAVEPVLSPVRDEQTGIRVVNPAEIINYPEVPVILLSYALGDMYRQLLDLGVDKKRIHFGPCLKPYNTFEKMLFENGGRLIGEDNDIFYENVGQGLYIKTSPSSLEEIAETLKCTDLYPRAESILENLPLEPLDDTYGMNRGTPVDRYYIEQFLESNKERIRGTVMEIGDDAYTRRFGGREVIDSVVLHVEKENRKINQIKGNFVTGEGLKEACIDCLICTQTLPFIYDLRSAADHMVKILKPGGTALITAGGISQIIQYEKIHYGHFWSFTDMSLERLFEENSDVASVQMVTYGNVKTAAAFLYGMCLEELSREELDFCDPNYQVIIGAVVKKK